MIAQKRGRAKTTAANRRGKQERSLLHERQDERKSGRNSHRKARFKCCHIALASRQGEGLMRKGAGNHGIRHPCGGSRCHRDTGNNGFQAEDSGAVGCNRVGNQQSVGKGASSLLRLTSECGQGTVEYALIMAGLLSIIVGMGALLRLVDGGLLVEHALMSASHHVQAVTPGAVADVFMY